jgi:hypothetical protein
LLAAGYQKLVVFCLTVLAVIELLKLKPDIAVNIDMQGFDQV